MGKVSRIALPILLVILLIAGLLTGCGQNTAANTASPASSASAAAATAAVTPAAQKYAVTGDNKVTLWTLAFSDSSTSSLTGGDPNKEPWRAAMEEKTGVHLEFVMTTNQDYSTKFSLLVSSGQMPDFFSLPTDFAGGVSKAFQDGLIIKINDYMDKDMPNIKAALDSNPTWMTQAKSDDGNIYGVPGICQDKSQLVYFGPIIRKDMLDKAGLGVPETMDDWHAALLAFKQQGCQLPFSAIKWYLPYSGAFAGAYGAPMQSSYLSVGQDGTLIYGPAQPGYKDFLATFAQWYKEGLIDPDMFTVSDENVFNGKMDSGKAASGVGWLSDMDDFNKNITAVDPNASFVAAKYPVLHKGDSPLYGQLDPYVIPGYAISAKGKNIDITCKYLDYYYSKDGIMISNFGVLGESYTLDASGNPVFTDLVLASPKNSKGWTKDQSVAMYSPISGSVSVGLQLLSSFSQLRLTDLSKPALPLWSDIQRTSEAPNLVFTKEETDTTKKLADIDTYVQEMTAKFITGSEPIGNFDQYIQKCKDMGLDDITAVYNQAYDKLKKATGAN